jgi:hypothetical protein
VHRDGACTASTTTARALIGRTGRWTGQKRGAKTRWRTRRGRAGVLVVPLLGKGQPSACTPGVRRTSASQSGSIAARRKRTRERVCAGSVRDTKERPLVRWPCRWWWF